MRRMAFVGVLALAACTALIAVVGSSAMPVNKHTDVATWTCADGGTYEIALALNFTSNHRLSFSTEDGSPFRFQNAHDYVTTTVTVVNGPTATAQYELDYPDMGQGAYAAGKLVGPCETTLVIPWGGVLEADLAAWLGLSDYIGYEFTAADSTLVHATFFVPQS